MVFRFIKDFKGIGIIEVLFSMLIFSIGIMAINKTFMIAVKTLNSNRKLLKSYTHLGNKLEEMIFMDSNYNNSGFNTIDGIDISWNIEKDKPVKGLAIITVVSRWEDSGGIHKKEIKTIKAQ